MRGLQSTLVLGATALCTANTQAAVVVNNFNRTLYNGYDDTIFFSYNAVNQTIVQVSSGHCIGAGFWSSKGGGGFLNSYGTADSYRVTSAHIAPGASVDSATTWVTYGAILTSGNYVGLRADQGSGNYNYGYAKYSVSNTSMTLESVAFETTVNTSITAVPEPSTSLLSLAGGAAALMGIRRRKAA